MKKLIKKHEEKIRFLLAGGWNTVFGYFAYATLYYLFSAKIHYMLLLIVSYVLAITNSYISYKVFVFKTKGNVLKEYIRFYFVYGASLLINLILMPILVEICHIHPLIAPILLLVITVIISYIGHKNFSFKA